MRLLKMYPIREAFERIGVKNSKGYEIVAAGLLDARKLGGRTLITADSVAAFIEQMPKFETRAKLKTPTVTPREPPARPRNARHRSVQG